MDTDILIKKWLSDELTDQERNAFELLEDASLYKEIISDAAHFKAEAFSEMPNLETFRKRLPITDAQNQAQPTNGNQVILNKPSENSDALTQKETPVRKLNWMSPMLKIASVLVLGLGIFYFFFLNQIVEVRTLAGQKSNLELPDASLVTLNALSEISYDAENWDTKREITLRGEAFFDVAKGAKFDVVTSEGTVTVLGTEFNVKQRGSLFEVGCFEGTVRVITANGTQILRPGDNFTVYGDRAITGNHRHSLPKWIKDVSEFKRIPVSEVIAELERQYDIKVELEGVDTNQLFTGGFTHDSLNGALRAICEPLNLEYGIIKPGTVRLNTRE